MKYIFLTLFCWAIGFFLPQFSVALQVVAAFVLLGIVVACVLYFIDTRINAIRL